ncbi:hypothetical protein LNTAR_11921 [Lentisphaera araneosa HTCC2155]|uniref:DUF1552 domain-containing protein n=1 Tax=Lentisphaera araneosa HTCC2155 TaxID=313628 RepID=A6DJI5_9BACT|nr:DUF1552 domain-containing protein [Lentisphaera araneosa]EDM28059.1 hypothetical protein LNTAR_11921 [Lentisphaera araneosa HTCC2155]
MSHLRTNRRRFLKNSAGALMLLPFLEVDAQTNKETIPKRMVTVANFYGLMPHLFFPKKTGQNYEMTRLLKPMAELRKDFSILNGLDHGMNAGHHSTKYFLSGIPLDQINNYKEANISVDQKAALHVGSATRYPSLVLGCKTNSQNYISWTKHGSQIRPISDLEQLYNLLFTAPNAQAKKKIKTNMMSKESILDLVYDQAKSFSNQLGKNDQEKLDQYFTSVRELEGKVAQSKLWLNKAKPRTNYQLPQDTNNMTLKQQMPLFYDLMTLALQTDSTRVISLSFHSLGNAYGGIPGVKNEYHALSHHGKVNARIDELALIESSMIEEFGRFLKKLKDIKEPNGRTMLDNTMALFGSGMSNGNSHSNKNLPIILAGGGFKHGGYQDKKAPLNNLYLSLLQNFGLEIDKFNTSTGTFNGLELKS